MEFVLRVGSRKPRADLVVFVADADHAQENSSIVVECKAQTVKASDRKEGVGLWVKHSRNRGGRYGTD